MSVATGLGLAPDPVLPQRDLLLDDEAVGDRLGCTVTRVRAKYRIGESLRVTFRATWPTGAGPGPAGPGPAGPGPAGLPAGGLVSARMFPPGVDGAQAQRAREAARAAGAGEGHGRLGVDAVVRHEPELSTVFWTFPHDRRLTGVDVLTAPPAPLRRAFGTPWAASTLVAYSPEKAATARWEAADGSVLGYAKVQGAQDSARSVAVLRAVRAGMADGPDAPALADLVAYHPEHHLVLCSVAPGRPLNLFGPSAFVAAMARLGAALRVLHTTPADALPPFTRLEPARLARAGELLAQVRPDVAPLADRVVRTLLAAEPDPAPPALLHGDLHPKNVLVHAGGISLVDLDQAGCGSAATELGGLLARLWYPRPGSPLDPDAADRAARALLDGYGDLPAPRDLRWNAAAALVVERAVRAVNRLDAARLDTLGATLTTALAWAEEAQS